MIGSTISHYKILEKLGEGGMGIVYKAEDLTLKRSVALKFLPHHLKTSETEQSRFLQEAQAIATLNHPNICTIHAIEEVEGQRFIVMEYVEGETLRQKIPVQKSADVLAFAIQIGDALAEAHAKGIVHRDIKADNIMVNTKNQIKVMDFGLAKLKGSMKLTRTSSTVGTLAYMAPEQIQGNEVDARSDIFSFGVVIFEMLTGHLPFHGEHEAAMMYSIMNEEPDQIEKYQSNTSPVLSNLIQRALEKDPNDRYQSVSDMVIELRRLQKQSTKVTRTSIAAMPIPSQVIQTPEQVVQPSSPEVPTRTGKNWFIITSVVLIILILGVGYLILIRQPASEEPIQASFKQLTDQPGAELNPTISPDGNYIAYQKSIHNVSHILLQRVGGGNPIDLTKDSKDDVGEPSFSPDGQSIAFRSEREGGGIFIMGATGESAKRLTDAGYDPSWFPDGKEIVYATEGISSPYSRNTTSQLWVVNSSSGEKKLIFEGDAVQPRVSPHSLRIAYWGLPKGAGQRDIWTIPVTGGEPVSVTNDVPLDWNPVWSPDGKYLYFSSDRGGNLNLWRISIDEQSGKVSGSPTPVTTPSRSCSYLTISRDGSRIVYADIDQRSNLYRATFDPVKESVISSPTPVTQGSRPSLYADISPDGQWVAFTSLVGAQEDVFVSRVDGSDVRQLTNDIYRDRGNSWSRDGKRIAFYSNRSGHYDIWSINADGSNLEQVSKTTGETVTFPFWLSDGMHLVANSRDGGTLLFDIRKPLNERIPEQLPPAGNDREVFFTSSVSPNEEWFAGSVIKKNGDPLPAVFLYSRKAKSYVQVSDSGGNPLWLNDNKRLLFEKNGNLWILNSQTKKKHVVMTAPENVQISSFKISGDNHTLLYLYQTQESDIWQATIK